MPPRGAVLKGRVVKPAASPPVPRAYRPPVRVAAPGPSVQDRLFGFMGGAVRGAYDVATLPRRGVDRRPAAQVARVGAREIGEQSGMTALDRIMRGQATPNDYLVLASAGMALTPGAAALRGGRMGKLFGPKGGAFGSGAQMSLLETIMQANQLYRHNQRQQRRP